MDLGDRVVGAPQGPEPVRDRQEVGLEDRFQHQYQRCLHDPVRDHGNTDLADLARPTRLRDLSFLHRQRSERAVLDGGPQVVQEPGHPDTLLHVGDGQPVDTGSVRTAVARDPVERHQQRRRVIHEIEQVIEPAARIGRRPTVKLGLHLRYPHPRPGRTRARSAAIRRRICRHCSIHPFSKPLPSFPMRPALPASEYYDGSAPPQTDRRSTRPAPPSPLDAADRARPGTVPVFTVVRSSEEEPDYAPAASPRVRRRPSSWPPGRLMPTVPGVPRPTSRRVRTAPGPDPSGSSRCLIKGVSHAGSSRTPLRPARRTRTI